MSNSKHLHYYLTMLLLCVASFSHAQPSPLHVEGPFLVNAEGKRVNMHGFAQTFSPWFNEQGTKWTNYNVAGCLSYNKGIIDKIMQAGWKMTFVRQHMDPYWSNNPGVSTNGESDISAFNFERFKTYLDQVFIPMAEYAISKGLYVVMRPPGVCPERISIGDNYQKYLLKVWEYVAQHNKLKNNGAILFELANEPIGIYNNNGTRAGDAEMTQYFQTIVNAMRKYCNNVLLIPGLGYQSQYAGFAKYPIEGENIGFAVHCYPGWYNGGTSDGKDVVVNYREFKRGWDSQILPVAVTNPVVVTEMDWGPSKYSPMHTAPNGSVYYSPRYSFGFSRTGVAGGEGFGANFHRIVEETCNVSWLLFTGGEILAQYNDNAADGATFLTDPEACPRPCFRWFSEYATQEYADMINDPDYKPVMKEQPFFSLSEEWFNPNIWETGTYSASTGYLKTGQYGFGGWQYPNGIDISAHRYLVAELKQPQSCGASFRLFDINNYWSKPYCADFGGNTRVVIDLYNMTAQEDGHKVDPTHIYIAGIWTNGSSPIYIKDVFLSDDGRTPTGVKQVSVKESATPSQTSPTSRQGLYNVAGQRISNAKRGTIVIDKFSKSKYVQQ